MNTQDFNKYKKDKLSELNQDLINLENNANQDIDNLRNNDNYNSRYGYRISYDKKRLNDESLTLFNERRILIVNQIVMIKSLTNFESYFKQNYNKYELIDILEELKDIKNKAVKTFKDRNILQLRSCKSDLLNHLFSLYFDYKEVLKTDYEYLIYTLNRQNNFFIRLIEFLINILESNIKSNKDFNEIEFYSLSDNLFFFKFNKNISKLKKKSSNLTVNIEIIKEVDNTLKYISINKDLFYKIFVHLISKEKYSNLNGLIFNKENNYISMFNKFGVSNFNLKIELDNNYTIFNNDINFELFNSIHKILKKNDFIELAVKESKLYIKLPDQTIKEVNLNIFDIDINVDDNRVITLDSMKANLIVNNLIKNCHIVDNYLNSDYLLKFESLERLKEVYRKLNIFDKTYKNEHKTAYNHTVNLNIKKRFIDLTAKTIEKISYEIKEGTKQVNEKIPVKNKKGKIVNWLDNFVKIDNMVTKYNTSEITENLINVFSSKFSKDYFIDINFHLDKFIQILDLMIKNEFLEIKLSNSQKELILHDNINFIIMSYMNKKD